MLKHFVQCSDRNEMDRWRLLHVGYDAMPCHAGCTLWLLGETKFGICVAGIMIAYFNFGQQKAIFSGTLKDRTEIAGNRNRRLARCTALNYFSAFSSLNFNCVFCERPFQVGVKVAKVEHLVAVAGIDFIYFRVLGC